MTLICNTLNVKITGPFDYFPVAIITNSRQSHPPTLELAYYSNSQIETNCRAIDFAYTNSCIHFRSIKLNMAFLQNAMCRNSKAINVVTVRQLMS